MGGWSTQHSKQLQHSSSKQQGASARRPTEPPAYAAARGRVLLFTTVRSNVSLPPPQSSPRKASIDAQQAASPTAGGARAAPWRTQTPPCLYLGPVLSDEPRQQPQSREPCQAATDASAAAETRRVHSAHGWAGGGGPEPLCPALDRCRLVPLDRRPLLRCQPATTRPTLRRTAAVTGGASRGGGSRRWRALGGKEGPDAGLAAGAELLRQAAA